MPNGWKKNFKYFNNDLTHHEYLEQKKNFRQWKKERKLRDNSQPFPGEYKGTKKFVPPKDRFNRDKYFGNDLGQPLSIDEESNWTLYLSKWKEIKSNQTFRHKGCRPNCGVCNGHKLYSHGKNVNGFRKYKNFKNILDDTIEIPRIPYDYSQGPYLDCVVCYDKKPIHVIIRLSCGKGQTNSNYICTKCRDKIYMTRPECEWDKVCPLCRDHPI